ncbi:hypothetical protein [Natrinema pallidum]|uniref:DUF7978 domain-containing protein n=2 Tax=Natrinema pallidum TaxID=69527 RepID=L9YZA3_9EURY|nr:hypothetical protein [Natrinema pallidum]ELY78817.1 hypothetical protein C487_07637 [Natrinema pallidum DSM 3751]QCW01801.1 hypothetical protein FGF80_00435 [Natrinema pallidum]
MSQNRRFEYDKGPRLEDDTTPPESDDDADADERPAPDAGDRRIAVAPWKAGSVAGVSAFVIVFAAFYQLITAYAATGSYGQGDSGPSNWVIAGLTTLANHGAAIQQGGEPIDGIGMYPVGLVPSVSALIPAVVLLAAGYFLVRYVALETRREAGVAVGAFLVSYVVLAVGLAVLAQWTPGTGTEGMEEGAITAATDLSLIVTVGGTVLTFALLGAGVAALPRLRPAGDE